MQEWAGEAPRLCCPFNRRWRARRHISLALYPPNPAGLLTLARAALAPPIPTQAMRRVVAPHTLAPPAAHAGQQGAARAMRWMRGAEQHHLSSTNATPSWRCSATAPNVRLCFHFIPACTDSPLAFSPVSAFTALCLYARPCAILFPVAPLLPLLCTCPTCHVQPA